MKDRIWMVLVVLVLASGAAAIGWWAYDRRRGDALPPGIIAASGRVEARDVRVAAATGGRVLRLAVAAGDRVRAGQLIAELDRRAPAALASGARMSAAAAEENVTATGRRIAALQSQRDLARVEAERARRLYAGDAAPRQAVERAEAALAQLESELRAARAGETVTAHQAHAARAQERAVSVQLDETTVTAPADGVVSEELARAGELVPAGGPIVLLRRTDTVTVTVYLPIAQAQAVRPGMEARAYVEGLGDRVVPGTVERVASEAEFTPKDVHMPDDRATLVFAVALRFPNSGGTLKDGFPADVYVRTRPTAPWPGRRPWR